MHDPLLSLFLPPNQCSWAQRAYNLTNRRTVYCSTTSSMWPSKKTKQRLASCLVSATTLVAAVCAELLDPLGKVDGRPDGLHKNKLAKIGATVCISGLSIRILHCGGGEH